MGVRDRLGGREAHFTVVRPWTRLSAAQWTVAMTVALAGAAAALTSLGSPGPLLAVSAASSRQFPVAVAIAAGFFFGEMFLINFEFRRQAHSMTLAGVPLVLGVLLVPGYCVVARVVGSLLAFAHQRIALDKAAYNGAAYAFEAAVDVAVLRQLLGATRALDAPSGMMVVAVVALVDQVMSCFVLLIIRLHNGPVSRKDATEVLLPAVVLSTVASVFGLAAVLLFEHGLLGAIVVVVLAAVGFLGYQAHAATRRNHQGLTLMHEFVAGGVGAESLEALAAELLARIRLLVRGSSTELLLLDDAGPEPQQQGALTPRQARTLTVGEDSRLVIIDRVVDPNDWTLVRALSSGEPLLATRTAKDRGVRGWLAERGLRDAIVVPFPASSGLTGTLSVTDRLGETATFTQDDVTLLQTLAGHLAVAVRGTRLVDKLGYDATHDSLTGLLNRAYLSARIHDVLAQPTPSAGVLLLDLDRFKEVNDGLGHEVGDRLLTVVGERLTKCVPTSATVARLGGDEFAILVPNLDDLGHGIAALAERIADALSKPVAFEEAMLTPEASIGIAVTSPAHPHTELLRQADTAMYHAKAHHQRVAIYTPAMDRGRVERLALLADLRSALTTHPEQFVLHYQPKVDLANLTVSGAEALVRWHHPTLGIVSPNRFIALAESTGLIEQLTPLVLNAALIACAQWPADLSVAVNLSARNISHPQFADRVATALSATGVRPDRLILEITESSVMGDPVQTLPVLHRLHRLGVCISLDDFGTGYSSLSYLQSLPVGELKVDRSFVVGLTGDDPDSSRAVIRAIASLGRSLGLRIVAEGIEDEATRQALLDLGCGTGQGFYFSRPLPAPEFQCWLDNRHPLGREGAKNRLRSVG